MSSGAINTRVAELTERVETLEAGGGGGGGGTPYASTPAPLGTASPGASSNYSRGDHIHAHGNLAGGSFHTDAIAGGASGFLSGTNASKLVNLSGTNSGDVSIGTANGLSLVGQALSLAAASSSAAGAMSDTDKAKLDVLTIYLPASVSVATLNTKITALAALGGGRIILGHGTLTSTSTININGAVVLEGQSEGGTVISYTGTGVAIQINSGAGIETLRAGLKYFTLDGNNSNAIGIQLGQSAVSPNTGAGYFENITVKRFVGAAGSGVKLVVTALATWVRCTFQSNRDGFWSSSDVDNGATTQTFISCRFITNTKRGLFIEQFDTWNILVCQFEDNGEEGCLVKHPGTSTTATRNITFDNSYFEDNGTAGAFSDLRFDNASTFSLAECAVRRTRFQGTNPDGNIWFGKGNFIEEDNAFSPIAITNCIASNSTVCFVVSRNNRAPSTYWTLGANAPTVHTRAGGDGAITQFYNLLGTATRYGYRPTTAATITHVVMDTRITASANAAAVTVNLISAATVGRGYELAVIKTDASANTVTIDPSGTQTINGASTYVLSTQYQRVTIISDGTNWLIVST